MEQGILYLLQNSIRWLNIAFSDMATLMSTTPDSFGGGTVWGMVTNINEALKGIGYALLLLFFLMSFLKSTSNFKDISIQQIIGLVVRFILVKALIDYSLDILNLMINVSLGATTTIASSAGTYTAAEVPQNVLDAINGVAQMEWWEKIPALFQTIPLVLLALVGSLVMWVCGIILVLVVYMRFFKIFIFTALAPLPLSSFGSPETSSTGKHFLKAYAAVCLEICVIALAVLIFNAIISGGGMQIWDSWSSLGMTDSAYGDYWGVTLNFIIQMVVQVVMLTMIVMGANKIVREVIGV